MASRFRSAEVGFALHWGGVALLGIYGVTVLAAAIPIRLLDPAWINRVCGSLRGGVSFPLIALALMLVSAWLEDPEHQRTYLPGVSRLAYLAALGFVLLIPLQAWASVSLLQQASAREKEQLKVFDRGLERIRLSLNQEQLSEAIASIPGAPRFTPGTLTVPLPEARQSLIRQIEPQLRQRAGQLRQADALRWREAWVRMVKDAFTALFAFLGFAAAGRRAPDRPTLLEALLFPELRRLGTLDAGVQAVVSDAEQHEGGMHNQHNQHNDQNQHNQVFDPKKALDPNKASDPNEAFDPNDHYP